MANSQIQKTEACLKSSKFKQIFKSKVKKSIKGTKGKVKDEIEIKISSKTNVCDEEEQEVSQYLSIWEENEAIA